MRIIPEEVKSIVSELTKRGFEAFVVGGCVRDLLLGRTPEDWDITTNAKPEEIQHLFPTSFYENKFFTVTVLTESKDPKLKQVEITTYRADARYMDRRRPEEVKYAKTIEEDLSRRDFTINAIALKLEQHPKYQIIDPFDGQKDLKRKLIRAVGSAQERFNEDALRMLRAARLATTLGFTIEETTNKAMQTNAALLKEISKERIRDELIKIIMAERSLEGIELLRALGLLHHIVPELEEGYGVGQNKHHIYTVWEHNLFSLQYAAKMKWNFEVRCASLLHDVAKPRVKKGEGQDSTFYNHETVGAKMTSQILSRLKFPRKQIQKISKLVRYHLFYYNVGEVTASSVRRLIRKVGLEDTEDLLRVRMADRIGSGVPKAEPYKLRHLKYLIEKVSQDPLSPKMLQVNGDDMMRILSIAPGPRIGWILTILLEEVLDHPEKNKREGLEQRVKELGQLSDDQLQKLASLAKKAVEKIETKQDEMVKQKYWVT